MDAIIFPGQGAQYVGMGKSFYDNFSEAKEVFSKIDEIAGFKLSEKCFLGPEQELKDTAVQQLAILAVSLAGYEIFKNKSLEVKYLSGLSLGEYSCLYAAGVLSLADLVVLVKERASAMQKAAGANPSTMLAVIGMERDVLGKEANKHGFYLANVNSASQIVISLKKEDKERINKALTDQGVKVIELVVSGGFHSPFMESAKQHLSKVMDNLEFCDASIPIVSNFTAQASTDKEEIKRNLIEQLVSPVLWKDCIDFMTAGGVDLFYEIGPSKVLRGLMRKINPKVRVVNIEKKEDI
jgi:[acyl-carrier-protein] S-malonyltransferase